MHPHYLAAPLGRKQFATAVYDCDDMDFKFADITTQV